MRTSSLSSLMAVDERSDGGLRADSPEQHRRPGTPPAIARAQALDGPAYVVPAFEVVGDACRLRSTQRRAVAEQQIEDHTFVAVGHGRERDAGKHEGVKPLAPGQLDTVATPPLLPPQQAQRHGQQRQRNRPSEEQHGDSHDKRHRCARSPAPARLLLAEAGTRRLHDRVLGFHRRVHPTRIVGPLDDASC